MKTLKIASGYDRLIPETKLERGLLEIAIRAAFHRKEVQVWRYEQVGTITVRDEWDEEGRLSAYVTVPTPEDNRTGSLLFDAMKVINFFTWVEDRGEPAVVWELEMKPTLAGDRVRLESSIAPYLPTLTVADLA